jgi:hypothetical protein
MQHLKFLDKIALLEQGVKKIIQKKESTLFRTAEHQSKTA